MKKRDLKGNLRLNKRSISRLKLELNGGAITNGEFSCLQGCHSEFVFCLKSDNQEDCQGSDDDDQLDPLNSVPFLACISGWC